MRVGLRKAIYYLTTMIIESKEWIVNCARPGRANCNKNDSILEKPLDKLCITVYTVHIDTRNHSVRNIELIEKR